MASVCNPDWTRCLWGHVNSATLKNHQNWAAKPLNIADLNQTLPLNSGQSRPPPRSVCGASVERSPLHFWARAVWNGVDFASSTTGAVPGKAAWYYPAALECVKNKSPSCMRAWDVLRGSLRFLIAHTGQSKEAPKLFSFLTRKTEVRVSSLSTISGSYTKQRSSVISQMQI